MGLGGVAGADPRFRNTPFPTDPDFTPWGAEESTRLASPITPGECNPWSPVGLMGATGLFPIQILQGPNLIVVHHEAITQPRRIYTDGRRHPPNDELLPCRGWIRRRASPPATSSTSWSASALWAEDSISRT